jgi:glycosyltransferase involved in cell wall biosynthesis
MSNALSSKCDLDVFLPFSMKAEGMKIITVPVKDAKKNVRKGYEMDKVKLFNDLLPGKFKGHKTDIVHGHDWVTAEGGRQIKEKYGIPLVLTIHNTILGKRKFAKVFIKEKYELEKSIHAANRIIAVSGHIKKDLMDFYGISPKKIRVVYNGVEYDKFRTGPDGKFIFFIGRIDPMKGVDYLLDAYSIVHKSYPEYKLYIYGEGQEQNVKAVKEQCSELGLENDVVFAGRVPQKKLLDTYSSCVLVCLPSVYEPFGLTVLEGAASGKPVITTSRSGASEIVDNWKNAVVVKPRNTEDLAKAMLKLLKDSDLRKSISREAVKLARKYSWDRNAKEIMKVYKELV